MKTFLCSSGEVSRRQGEVQPEKVHLSHKHAEKHNNVQHLHRGAY